MCNVEINLHVYIHSSAQKTVYAAFLCVVSHVGQSCVYVFVMFPRLK